MRRSGLGHRHVADFGLQGHAYRRQKYPLRSLRDTGVLLRRNPHDRGRVYRIPPPREGRDVEKRITVFERIEPRMVAEGAFDGFLLRRVDITLDHEVAVGRDINIVGDALHEFHGTAAQEPGQQVFVHVVGHRRRRGISIGRIAAQRHRHGHPPPRAFPGIVMPGPRLVDMPVHARRMVVEDLHAVHADVAHARLGIDRVHHRQGYETPAVGRPALQDRKRRERRLSTRLHDLLAFAPPRHRTRKPAGHPGQQRQRPQLVRERRARRHGLPQQSVDPFREFAERPDAQRQRHAACGTEHVGQHGKIRAGIFEQQRLAAAGHFRNPVGYLGDLLHRRHRSRYADEFALALQQGDILTQASVHAPTPFSPTRIAAATPVPAPRKAPKPRPPCACRAPRVCRSSTAC